MKTFMASNPLRAFTRVEALVVACALGLFLLLLVPIGRAKDNTRRSQCIANLKEMGTALSMYNHDNEARPMFSSLRLSMEGKKGDLVSLALQQMSNWVAGPRVLSCPGLSQYRPTAESWAKLEDRNIGYAIGDGPLAIGDLDIEGGVEEKVVWGQVTGMARVFTSQRYGIPDPMVQWSKTNHVGVGQMGLADGTVVSGDSTELRRQISLSQQDGPPPRLFLPR